MKVIGLDKDKRYHILTIQEDECEPEKKSKSQQNHCQQTNGGVLRFLGNHLNKRLNFF